MRLYILGGNKLGKINANDKTEKSVSVNYKYNDQLSFPVNLEKSNDSWQLVKNDFLNIEKDGMLYNNVVLENYKLYFLNLLNIKGKIAVMPSPSFDTSNYNLVYNDLNEFTIGKSNSCNISYNNPLTLDIHAKVFRVNDIWNIEAIDNAIMYVNDNLTKKAVLKIGDIIFINGLKIIWNNDFIRVNNPLNMQIKGFRMYSETNDNTTFEEENDLINVELYEPNEYYYPKLLINNKLVDEVVTITPPPESNKVEELPFLLTLGSSVTMLGSSFMMTYMIIYNMSNGSKSIAAIIPQIVMCACMIIGSLIMPKVISGYNKKKNKKNEKLRKTKYTEYIEEKKKEVEEIINKEQVIMNENNPNVTDCMTFMKDGKITNIKFWSRSIKDSNFATLRLGNGDMPSKLTVDLPEKGFVMETDELEDKMYEIGNLSKTLHNVPIVLDLKKDNKTGIMLRCENKWDYINGLILQLIMLHSPYDLKIVILTSKENESNWEYVKYLPHLWSDNKQTRFFASTIEEIQKVSEYLSNEYKNRKSSGKTKVDDSLEVTAEEEAYQKEDAYKTYQPYYLVIDDNYEISKNSLIVSLLNETAVNFGFSYMGIGDQAKDFPNSCSTFIEINDKTGDILNKNVSMDDIIKFNNEFLTNVDMRNIANMISNVPILVKDQESSLPQTLGFLEMLDASRIEQLNILNRWKTNNPVASLATPVGVHANGEKFKLDLHEKAHGPHGLIAGMTGSGKSEFIITYILSMIVNYHPYEVQFVLIDYKGGGLAGAFENKELGYKIPHLVGTITNLDTAEMNRTLVSIQSECRRRQLIFNEVKDKLGESTIDIYKYQRLYREGLIKEPMAHLFIISDEFAELKASQPEFMSQLIQVARIGRSLGIHLILATQKPSGVVNDQIWSNSKFKVCLKVQDRSDSMEMLKKPDAASIKETGRFYLQVGYDDYFDIGQSGWSGAKYIPTDNIIKKIDDSINYVTNTGDVYKTIKNVPKALSTANLGDQLTNVVKAVCDVAKSQNIKTSTLWLDKIPENIYVENLKRKYEYKPVPYYINPVIGEYDNPNNQEQGLLNLDLTNGGNTLIYGATGSGKEMLMSTIITSISLEHNPSEVNMYILDFGSESLKVFSSIPHVGDIATIEEPNKVMDTFDMIYDLIEERKKLFADYSGSYLDYIKSSGNKLPLIVVFINNYEIFVENNNRLSDEIMNLYRDSSKYGIMFVISVITPSAIRSRMAQYFENKICLELPDDNGYRDVLGSPRGLIPSKFYGRGITEVNEEFVEFQTASIVQKEKFNEWIRAIGKKMSEAYNIRAKSIPTVPSIIGMRLFENSKVALNDIPIGYDMTNKKPISYDISAVPFHSIVTENMTEEKMSFIYAFTNMLTKIDNTVVKVVDMVDAFDKNPLNLEIYKDNWEQTIVKLYNDIVNGEKDGKTHIYIMLGIGQAKKFLSPQLMELLNKVLLTMNKDSNSKFILVDTYTSFKNLGTEVWYQSSVDNSYGIWLGENVGTQLAINISNLTMDDRKVMFMCMAFMVLNGKHKIVKHMVENEADFSEE